MRAELAGELPWTNHSDLARQLLVSGLEGTQSPALGSRCPGELSFCPRPPTSPHRRGGSPSLQAGSWGGDRGPKEGLLGLQGWAGEGHLQLDTPDGGLRAGTHIWEGQSGRRTLAKPQ